MYGLESNVLLEPHVCHLESFVISCLWIILGVSVREKKCHTTMRTMAKQQRISSILSQRHLRFLGHLSMMPKDQLPRQFLMVGSVLLEDRSDSEMVLWPATLKSATCLEPEESMPKNITLGAPSSITV